MRLLIDANIVLDVLQKREPHYKNSSIIWKLCETRKVEGHISILPFMNLTYMLRKELTPEKIEEVFKALSLIFVFEDLTQNDVVDAISMKHKDFEDAVQIQTANRVSANYIITRNVRDFMVSPIPAYTPEEFLSRVDIENL